MGKSKAAKATAAPVVKASTKKKRKHEGKQAQSVAAAPRPLTVAHRVQFVDWQPAAITALAFSPDGTYLACGRNGGEIQLWNVAHGWHLERTVVGRKDTAVSKLVWLEVDGGGARLFAAGLHGEISEVCLQTLRSKWVVDSYGGAVWDLAVDVGEQKLYAACDDGSLRVFDCGNRQLSYEKMLSGRTPKRLLTVCLQGDIVYSAGEEGIIRSWTKKSGEPLPNTIRVETMGGAAAGKTTIVWSLKVLSDHTLISGDSLGHTQVWDGRTGGLLASFSQHTADVVALAVNSQENIVFASGNDHKVVMIRLIGKDDTAGRPGVWKYSYAHRAHTHDVRALAIGTLMGARRGQETAKRQHTKHGESLELNEIVASGGQDTQICWYNVDQFEKIRPVKVLPYPHRPMISLCKAKKLLLARYETSLKLWQLGDAPVAGSTDTVATESLGALQEDLIFDINLSNATKGQHTTCADISPNGAWIAVGSPRGLRLYAIDVGKGPNGYAIEAVKCPKFAPNGTGVLSVVFTPDNKRLLLTTNTGRLFIVCLTHGKGGIPTVGFPLGHWETAREILPSPWSLGRLETMDGNESSQERYGQDPLQALAVSDDCQWLACADAGNRVHVYALETEAHHGSLPTPPAQHTAMTFLGGDQLLVSCVDNDFCLYEVEDCKVSWWHSANPRSNIPRALFDRAKGDMVVGLASCVQDDPDMVLLYSNSYFVKINFRNSVPPVNEDLIAYENRPLKIANRKKHSKQRKTGSAGLTASVAQNFRITDRYRPVLFLDFINKHELVVVERPWVNILQNFIDPVYVKKYGAC